MKGACFDFLDDVDHIRKSDGSIDYAIHDLSHEHFGVYVNQVFVDRREKKLSDVGDLMLESYANRLGRFSINEKTIVRDFFWDDYSFSCAYSDDCLLAFETGEVLDVKESPEYLALVLARRAYESLREAKVFSGLCEEMDGDCSLFFECFTDLKRRRMKARLANEFPNNYLELIDLIRHGEEAASAGDISAAARCDEGINEITFLDLS
jgi:hypothetical protein